MRRQLDFPHLSLQQFIIKLKQINNQLQYLIQIESMQEQAATYLTQKANTVNTDMTFLKQLAQPSLQAASLKPTKANNIDNLAQLLKLKNSRYSFSQQARETGQEWVKKKGGDLNPLIERFKQVKQQVRNKQQEKKSQSQCYFYMPKITYENQDVYIQKNFQFGVICAVQSIMSQDKKTGNLAKRILNQRRINRINNQQSQLEGIPTANLQIRNPRKKQQYLRATKEIVNIESALKGTEWAIIYRAATKQQFWQIITGQIMNLLDQSSTVAPISSLAISSLKMVQSEFNSTLPSNYQSILYYLTNNYLGKMRGQYDTEGVLGPVWGISYMLYRAGRKDQFYRYVPNQELKNMFQQADISIMHGKPKKFQGVEEKGNDLFQHQLLYALKGQSKCSTQALCDPNALDIVWVFLRNVGIFPQDANTFVHLRRQLYQSYKGPLISETKIRNLLYLLGYGEVAQIGPNEIMDKDDYVHFLIALYHSPAFELILGDKRQVVQTKLTEQVIQYIQQLLLQHKDQYLYYVLVIPKSRLCQEISSIIASSQLLQTIDWKYLAKKLQPPLYQHLIQLTLEKYVSIHQDYMQVAKKQCQLLNNNRGALDFVLQMLIKLALSSSSSNHILSSVPSSYSQSGRMSREQIRKCQQFAEDIMRKDEKLKEEYRYVFEFFQESFQLISLIQERNEHKIVAFLRQSHYVLLSQQLRFDVRAALQKLISHQGSECYITFLRNMIKSFEIALTRMNKLSDLLELQTYTLTSLYALIRNQQFAHFQHKETFRDLVRILEQAVRKY